MHSAENVPIAPLTTLRLGGAASRMVSCEREAEIVEAVRDADARGAPLFVLGGGSNVVVGDEGWGGVVVRIASRGIDVSREGDRVVFASQAGERWVDLVLRAVDHGARGVECLAGIPGLVGATPMQNVGAYGQDVSMTMIDLRAFDREANEIVTLANDACGFGYRSSRFRGSARHVILSVRFGFERSGESAPIAYAELARGLGVREGERAPLRTVHDTVIALRRKKGMVLDPADPDTVSAGSFFTNPVIDASAFDALSIRAADILAEGESVPRFAEGDRVKVAAAWLIERAGFPKGWSRGAVGISTKHALALVNRGGATSRALVEAAREIRDGVRARFGVTLEPEPIFVGVSL